MLLFFSIIVIACILVLIIIFADLRLNIKNLEVISTPQGLQPKYDIAIELYTFKNIKLFNLKLKNDKKSNLLKSKFFKERLEKIKNSKTFSKKEEWEILREVFKLLRKKLKIETFKLKINIDTEDVLVTSYLVGIISAVVPNILRNHIENSNPKKIMWKIVPLYKNKNYVYLELSSIISIKIVHISNMLKIVGGIKDERSSNRRLNVNCYGKY